MKDVKQKELAKRNDQKKSSPAQGIKLRNSSKSSLLFGFHGRGLVDISVPTLEVRAGIG